MIYTPNHCTANCAFCAQARESTAKANRLSRVIWPDFPISNLIENLQINRDQLPFQRLCIQTLVYPQLIQNLKVLVKAFLTQLPDLPISLALPPLTKNHFQLLYDLGVDRVAVSLDAVSPELFQRIKGATVNGPFSWERHNQALDAALSVFGKNRTTTHLIVGLGESEYQVLHTLQTLTDKGITIGLFPFTPVKGTALAHKPRPSLSQYRRIQLAHYLIREKTSHFRQMTYDSATKQVIDFGVSQTILHDIITRESVFQTTGCPSCNRPFFTEDPGGPLYNYPHPPSDVALHQIRDQLGGIL
jgi:biotin synthase